MELKTIEDVRCDDPRAKEGSMISVVHRRRFAVGIDLGQAHDPTAICVASSTVTSAFNPAFAPLFPTTKPRYEVHHLERLKLGFSYTRQVDYIAEMMRRDPLVRLRPSVLVDYTGVGRPVFDMFLERPALRLAQGVAITSGREVIPNSVGWSVPKVELVSKLQALLHSGNLKVHMGLSDAPVLVRELKDFRVKYSEAGNATFNAREGAHDDLVLALALAVFGLSRPEYATADDLKVTWAQR